MHGELTYFAACVGFAKSILHVLLLLSFFLLFFFSFNWCVQTSYPSFVGRARFIFIFLGLPLSSTTTRTNYVTINATHPHRPSPIKASSRSPRTRIKKHKTHHQALLIVTFSSQQTNNVRTRRNPIGEGRIGDNGRRPKNNRSEQNTTFQIIDIGILVDVFRCSQIR